MDHAQFDDLTRSVVAEDGTRRAVLRLLVGGALGGLAARLGLREVTEAKPKPHRVKRKAKRKPHAERQAHQPPRGAQAAGKGKGQGKSKGKGKHDRKKPQNPPPPPPPCAAGTKRCGDGSCIPDLPYTCCPGQRDCGDEGCYPANKCCPSQTKCPDGSCHQLERYECCPGQKSCGDEGCFPEDQCCFHERKCGDDSCIRPGSPDYQCCPSERECGDEGCVPADQCCPGQKQCPDGSCMFADECCPGQKRCGAELCIAENACCPGMKPCDDGSCIAEDECCFDASPCGAGGCQRVVCVNGQEQCLPVALGTPCKMPGGAEGTCCNGQCTKEALVCPAYPWREFNPNTCRCDCPDGGTDADVSSGHRYCCPAGFPVLSFGGICYADPVGTHVCMMGHHFCPSPYPDQTSEYCCRDGT